MKCLDNFSDYANLCTLKKKLQEILTERKRCGKNALICVKQTLVLERERRARLHERTSKVMTFCVGIEDAKGIMKILTSQMAQNCRLNLKILVT